MPNTNTNTTTTSTTTSTATATTTATTATTANSCPTTKPLCFLINAPADSLNAHETALKQLAFYSDKPGTVAKVILMSAAAPIAAAFDASNKESVAARYHEVLSKIGCECLVCGQAAAHYGIKEESKRNSIWKLTGYAEIVMLLFKATGVSSKYKILVW